MLIDWYPIRSWGYPPNMRIQTVDTTDLPGADYWWWIKVQRGLWKTCLLFWEWSAKSCNVWKLAGRFYLTTPYFRLVSCPCHCVAPTQNSLNPQTFDRPQNFGPPSGCWITRSFQAGQRYLKIILNIIALLKCSCWCWSVDSTGGPWTCCRSCMQTMSSMIIDSRKPNISSHMIYEEKPRLSRWSCDTEPWLWLY